MGRSVKRWRDFVRGIPSQSTIGSGSVNKGIAGRETREGDDTQKAPQPAKDFSGENQSRGGFPPGCIHGAEAGFPVVILSADSRPAVALAAVLLAADRSAGVVITVIHARGSVRGGIRVGTEEGANGKRQAGGGAKAKSPLR